MNIHYDVTSILGSLIFLPCWPFDDPSQPTVFDGTKMCYMFQLQALFLCTKWIEGGACHSMQLYKEITSK